MNYRRNQVEGISTAFTCLELLACVTCFALVLAVLAPVLTRYASRSDRVACLSNLRQIGVAYSHFGLEHGDLPPWRISTRDGGNLDYLPSSLPGLSSKHVSYVQFSILSNSLDTPRYLADPGDVPWPWRLNPAEFWSTNAQGGLYHFNYRNRSISYFIGVDGNFRFPRAILAGDRNLSTEGPASTCSSGISPASTVHTSPSGSSSRWTNDVHGLSGNLLFYDGSAARQSQVQLQRTLLSGPDDTPGTTTDNFHIMMPF
ncbi:MAG: type II secretion system GspH family protein [Verrucomicrobia subdivision 3 bacterium]|nr:type II secretion system GspH family protein [Limisphaerales bacterium]